MWTFLKKASKDSIVDLFLMYTSFTIILLLCLVYDSQQPLVHSYDVMSPQDFRSMTIVLVITTITRGIAS